MKYRLINSVKRNEMILVKWNSRNRENETAATKKNASTVTGTMVVKALGDAAACEIKSAQNVLLKMGMPKAKIKSKQSSPDKTIIITIEAILFFSVRAVCKIHR